jgi:UDP-glucuronate 4-epimerase
VLLGRVLVTGIAGFIGSHLGQALVRAGLAVRGVDAFTDTYAVEQKRENVALFAGSPSLELYTADLAQIGIGELYDLLADVEAVVHLAGQPGVSDSWGAPFELYVERNVTATQRLLDASAARVVSRSCELEDLEGSVHDAAGLATGFGDVTSAGEMVGADCEVAQAGHDAGS